MSNEFSQKMSEILSLSKEEATRLRSGSIKPEHLLLGIIRNGKGCALDILNSFDINIQEIKRGYKIKIKSYELHNHNDNVEVIEPHYEPNF